MVTRLRRGAEPLTALLPFNRDSGVLSVALTPAAVLSEMANIRVRIPCACTTSEKLLRLT